jgi:hypothetical protein
MKRWLFLTVVLTNALAATLQPDAASPGEQGSQLIAHYPLLSDFNDATGSNPPILAKNAPFQAGKGVFCNGQYVLALSNACEVRTPPLEALNLSTFTISAQFLVPRAWGPGNPVFVAGANGRWLYYELGQGGAVRLVYNNSQRVDCTVKYRVGAWHEATITFDGETTTLYLDGVPGCRASAPLQPRNEKVILLTNYANATTFYGMLRDLKVSNGVVVPPQRTAVPDSMPAPVPEDLAPADHFLSKCPTREQVRSVDGDLRLQFESDPTGDEPLACTTAAGSRDLSPMKKRVYNTLLLMKQLEFDRPLPWTRQPLYRWFIDTVDGIRFRSDIRNSSCCQPARTISMAVTNLVIRHTDRWVEPAVRGGLDGFLLVLVHEARHAQGLPHTCGSKDQTLDEMGSWAVQYYLARWLAEHTDQSFFTSGKIRYTERLLREADNLRKQQFCQ